MPIPTTAQELVACIAKSGLIAERRLDYYVDRLRAAGFAPDDPKVLAHVLMREGHLTKYQAEQLVRGRWRNFEVGGKYKILERLGFGGMATVFLCEHRAMHRLVAVKILQADRARDAACLEHFRREARAVSRVNHPNIVSAHDLDEFEGLPYLVLEYADGRNLESIVFDRGPLSSERVANYVAQVARALEHVEEVGLVHRDVKPGNLLVDRRGTVKLLDFGLSLIRSEAVPKPLNGQRYLLGTIDYVAPEQARDSDAVDIRADLYGLGASAYFLLTGQGVFPEGNVPERLARLQSEDPVPLEAFRDDVPGDLAEVVERLLAKDPEDRYQSPGDVVEALAPLLERPLPPPGEDDLPLPSLAVRKLSPYALTSLIAAGASSSSLDAFRAIPALSAG